MHLPFDWIVPKERSRCECAAHSVVKFLHYGAAFKVVLALN